MNPAATCNTVPSNLQSAIIKEAHEGTVGGHLGQDKILYHIKQCFYWIGHFNDIRNWCRSSNSCTTRKTPAPSQQAPLGTIAIGYPMQIVATDIVGPLPESDGGNCYILLVADYFTRWMEAFLIPHQDVTTVANKLVDENSSGLASQNNCILTRAGNLSQGCLVKCASCCVSIHKTKTTPCHMCQLVSKVYESCWLSLF